MNRSLIPVLTLALATASACSNPVVGEWEGYGDDLGAYNTMTVDADMTGYSTIYFSYDGDNYYADFFVDGEWTDDDIIEFDMECDGDCSFIDFDMTCTINDAGDDMKCDGNGRWTSYGFVWEKTAEPDFLF